MIPSRDTPETVKALRDRLKKKELTYVDIGNINTGLDCFYWAMKFVVNGAITDRHTEETFST